MWPSLRIYMRWFSWCLGDSFEGPAGFQNSHRLYFYFRNESVAWFLKSSAHRSPNLRFAFVLRVLNSSKMRKRPIAKTFRRKLESMGLKAISQHYSCGDPTALCIAFCLFLNLHHFDCRSPLLAIANCQLGDQTI